MQGAIYHIDRATSITRKLTNFAKPIREVSIRPVAMERELQEVLALVGHDLALQKIEVRKDLHVELPEILVDRGQFQEILFNLIRNAGQAIQPPGTIWVRAYPRNGGSVRIEIADTGCGIPPDKLGKIFDPFFTTKDPGKGTGLGLFIVRQIIERNKGRISVESAVGRGTTFFLDFPGAVTAEGLAR
jgi:signal transduction histidine kinase